jgi:protein-L-isoaspartate(D-aspartate) O-methyltransferase
MAYESERQLMVETQLRPRGIKDERVLDAMGSVPRHMFMEEGMRSRAYEDCALPIGEGQTISQPYMVAVMTELLGLKGNEKVLEIGTGSGYQAAVLSMLTSEVHTVERIPSIASSAETRLMELGYSNVNIYIADGTIGLSAEAPFDGIIVTAGAPGIPDQYVEQLKPGGRLVIPVGTRYSQVLYQVTKTKDVNALCFCSPYRTRGLGRCRQLLTG